MEVGRQEKWQAEQKGRVRIDGRVCRDRERCVGSCGLPDRQPSMDWDPGVQRRQPREVLLPWSCAAANSADKRDVWADGEGRRPGIFQANLMFLNSMKS